MDQLSTVNNMLNDNQVEEAISFCSNWIKTQPTDPHAHHSLGMILANQSKYQEAATHIKNAIRILPSEPSFHTNLANTFKHLGELHQCEIHYNQALKLNPNATQSYNNLGALYYKQNRFEESLKLFEKSLRINPKLWETHYNIANALINLDFVERAIIHYEIAKKLSPDFHPIDQNLGMAYVINKRFSKALPLLENTCKLYPEHSELQLQLAEVYLETGQTIKAIEQHQHALSLNPGNHPLVHNLAVLYLRNKDIDLAKQYFQKAVSLDPEDKTAKHMLSALEQDKNPDQAPLEYVQDLFNQYAQFYNTHVKDSLEYKVPEMLRSKVGNILGNQSQTLRILDVGCGTGLCGVYFSDISFFMVGIDISYQMLIQAKAILAYDGLCQANILNGLPGTNVSAFDLIIAADVFVYIGELSTIFEDARLSLADKGLFCFTVENSVDNESHSHKLQSTGRFSHSQSYIESLIKKYKFKPLCNDEVVLRKNENKHIHGTMYILEKL